MPGSNNNIDWRYAITGLKAAGLRVAALKPSPAWSFANVSLANVSLANMGGSKVADNGVVYLYRFVEGATPVRTFLNSYRAHPAGLGHDLHVILKGFPDRQALAEARALFGSLPINTIEVDDTGYDIGSYVAAAKSVANAKLLFLNTFSEILADNWLAHFDAALNMPGTGLVGATGSWQSISSNVEAAASSLLRNPQHFLGLYRKGNISARPNIVPKRAARSRRSLGLVAGALINLSRYPKLLFKFRRYPNPHIRSNAFMIRRELFLSLTKGNAGFRRKMDAYKFESGRSSMTRQILSAGLCASRGGSTRRPLWHFRLEIVFDFLDR